MEPIRRVLVTGGTGYIGSHASVALMQAGFEPILFDNLSNSIQGVTDRIAAIAGHVPPFVRGDIRDREALDGVFREFEVHAVMHFAGLKAVGDSVRQPQRYWEHNVLGSENLLRTMRRFDVRRLVFSSSATVYDPLVSPPIAENAPLLPASPYGETKQAVEDLLLARQRADPRWRVVCLRYFNPVGAHPSGQLGEDPLGPPNNLMPYVSQVAVGRRPRLDVFGGDYGTTDGTGVRDYIHVMDLVDGHVAALNWLAHNRAPLLVNLGTGRGVSVLELVAAFERVSGRPIPYRIVDRRPGDVEACWADVRRAERLLGWRARRSLEDMCRDAWAWQSANPRGYRPVAASH